MKLSMTHRNSNSPAFKPLFLSVYCPLGPTLHRCSDRSLVNPSTIFFFFFFWTSPEMELGPACSPHLLPLRPSPLRTRPAARCGPIFKAMNLAIWRLCWTKVLIVKTTLKEIFSRQTFWTFLPIFRQLFSVFLLPSLNIVYIWSQHFLCSVVISPSLIHSVT